jgi:hypothetical protein
MAIEHVDILTGEIHVAHNFTYADAAAREGATLASTDVGRIAKQTDNESYWVLADETGPIWVRISFGHTINAQTGTTYTVLATDRGKLVTHTNAGAIAVTLPQASSTGFGADWFCWVQNRGAGAVTITPTTSTIDGAATLVLNQNEGALIVSDGTNYFTMRGKATGAAGVIGGATGGTDNAALRADGTGGATLQSSNLTIPDDAATTEVGYLNIPQNSQTADYTAVIADRGKHLYHPTSDDNPRTFTIPANASVAFAIGTAITFINDQNTLTIAITSDTLVWADDGSTGSRTLAENGMATAIKVTSTRWIISGTGLT